MLETKEAPQIYSVENLNRMIRDAIESRFVQVWVKGEISNFKAHTSGHFYFSLKDRNSQVRAVMFRGHNSKLRFKPHDGLEVIIRGKVSVYEPRGEYQITCDMMEPVGAGSLQKNFEELKTKLRNEGLFEASRKKSLPEWPKKIAIVTSPTGAAIQDMLNILKRRARGIEIVIVPTLVQGETAAPKLRQAYQAACQIADVEVVILGRGGGSIEDMWCFNDEALARLISASKIPTISAVGHEIDFTICDFVSDLRAPTPSAAAELVVKSTDDLLNRISSFQKMILLNHSKTIHKKENQLNMVNAKLIDPQRKLQDLMQRCDDQWTRLQLAYFNYSLKRKSQLELLNKRIGSPQNLIEKYKNRVSSNSKLLAFRIENLLSRNKSKISMAMGLLDSLSPLKVVDRGYSITTNKNSVLKSVKQVTNGDEIKSQVSDGYIISIVNKIEFLENRSNK